MSKRRRASQRQPARTLEAAIGFDPGAATIRSATSRWNISVIELIPGRPGLGLQPADEERRRDVVGQVGDDRRRSVGERGHVGGERVAGDDCQPAGIALVDLGKRRKAALVALDRDHPAGAGRKQRAGQSARAGADLDHGDAGEVAGGAGDAQR